jgi:peptide/nickel transport system substrate-binding protein
MARHLVLALGASVLAACASQPAPVEPEPRVIRVVTRAPIRFLRPGLSHDTMTLSVLSNVFDTLVTFDHDMGLIPALCTSWSNPTDLTWELQLRQDVRFHNGQPLTARDVKHTLERVAALEPTWSAARVPTVAEVRVVDEHRVAIDTRTPEPLLLNWLADVMILPESAGESDLSPSVGTGPYRVTSFSEEGTVELTAFADHWRGAQYWARATFQGDPDAASRLERLTRGDADLIEIEQSPDPAAVASTGGVQLWEYPSLRLLVLGFNVIPDADNPFADPEVRRAIALAIDRSAMVRQVFDGGALAASQLAPPAAFGYARDEPGEAADLEEARAALARSRHPKGFSAKLTFGERDRKLAEFVSSSTSAIGIRLEHEELSWKLLGRHLFTRRSQAFLYQMSCPRADASELLSDALHTRSADGQVGALNFSGYSDPKLDTLLERSARELNPRRRFALMREAMDIAAASRALIPLCVPPNKFAARAGLSWSGNPRGRILLEELREGPRAD